VKEGSGASDDSERKDAKMQLPRDPRDATPQVRAIDVGRSRDGPALAAAAPVVEQFVQSCYSSNSYAAG